MNDSAAGRAAQLRTQIDQANIRYYVHDDPHTVLVQHDVVVLGRVLQREHVLRAVAVGDDDHAQRGVWLAFLFQDALELACGGLSDRDHPNPLLEGGGG